jgi:predicted TIM-barrel fold metal-dependent hydrolase
MYGQALYLDLLEEIRNTPTIDAHEHLPPEEERLKEPRDFYSLFQHYCQADLVAAGATPADMALFADRSRPLNMRWERFRPFLGRIRTGSYARAALIVVQDLLGCDDLNDTTFESVSGQLQGINTPGLYDRILRERCNLAACIQCFCLDRGPYPDYFYHLAPGSEVVDLTNQQAVNQLTGKCDHPIHSLRDVLTCMTDMVERWRRNPKVVGIKSAHAYGRGIGFQKTTIHEAETTFNRVLTQEGHQLSAHEAIPLQDFLMFELVARAEAVQLPMVFHTGLQAGNYNRIENANPLLLQSLLEEFPQARFDLFHGGMPWVREIAVLAKYFPGVYLNMAWMHIINPAQARSALSEWLDMVPNNKIFGFGGDYGIVEKVYGHLKMARENIAAVLADKVERGAFSRAVATYVIRRLMLENATEFYGLKIQKAQPAGAGDACQRA